MVSPLPSVLGNDRMAKETKDLANIATRDPVLLLSANSGSHPWSTWSTFDHKPGHLLDVGQKLEKLSAKADVVPDRGH